MANQKVILKSYYGRDVENTAGGAITPGHLIDQNSSGNDIVHATEGGWAPMQIAVEDALQGNTLSTAYASGALVKSRLLVKGDEFYGFIAAGESVTPATNLISAGDGTFKDESNASSGVTVKQILCRPTETVDNSATGATATRCKMRVL